MEEHKFVRIFIYAMRAKSLIHFTLLGLLKPTNARCSKQFVNIHSIKLFQRLSLRRYYFYSFTLAMQEFCSKCKSA